MTNVSYRDFTGTGAENYERYFVPTIAKAASVDFMHTAALQRGERVLDVACGTGLIARLAAELVGPTGSVAGVDLAPDMIDVARATAAPAGPVIDWHVSDAGSLPIPDDSHDVVLCQMGLMFIEDRAAAIAEMRRVLVPGGRVVVNTPGPIQEPFEQLEAAIVDHISPDLGAFVSAVFSMSEPDQVVGLLTDTGLTDVTATLEPAGLRLPGPADFLWQYINLTPMAPLVDKAPSQARDAMEQHVVESWKPFVTEGITSFEQPFVIATGTK